MRVLVVDDSQLVLETVELLLSESGHTVTICARPGEALKALSAHDFDIVICDLFMPSDTPTLPSSHTAGMDLLWHLNDIYPRIRCIGMSGEVDAGALDTLKRAGVCSVLSKPFGAAELNDAVGAE